MPGENIQDWSVTAANNATADTSINWAEGQARASVNDSARSMMAAHAKDRDLQNGSIVTGGSANAQSFTSPVGYTIISTGLRVMLKIGPGLTNTGAATLNMDGIGAVAIKTETGADLTAGLLTAGTYEEFRYDGTNWILLGFSGVLPATTINGNLTVNGNETVSGAITGAGITSSGNLNFGVGYVLTGGMLRLTSSGATQSGFNGLITISCTGASTQYGIVIRSILDNGLIQLFTNSVDVTMGSISNNSGSVTSYNTTCDGDMKTNIEDLPSVGPDIDNLRPVKFRWKAQPEAGDFTGFIAQEAHRIAPQAVTPGRDGIPWMMDYSKLVPLLVAELKSLRKRVAELEAK